MAEVSYNYVVNDMSPQNPEILQTNLNKQNEKRKKEGNSF